MKESILKEHFGSVLKDLHEHYIPDVYKALAPVVQDSEEAQELWLELLRSKYNLFRLKDFAEEMEAGAKAGNKWMEYAWARFNHAVRKESNWAQTMSDYYDKAEAAGIADATYYIAAAWRDGDFGLVNMEEYHKLINQAVDKGSHAAVMQRLRDMMYGNFGSPKDAHGAFEMIDKFVTDSEKSGEHMDARYYHLLADVAHLLGRNAIADQCYERALENGDISAWYWLTCLRACDEEFHVADFKLMQKMVSEGQAMLAPESYVGLIMMVKEDDYKAYDKKLQEEFTEELKRQLPMAWALGEDLGAYFMGDNYYRGAYGFEKDNEAAWGWYASAAILGNSAAYLCMAEMIEAGDAPETYDEEFEWECTLNALRQGEDDVLDDVVEAYKRGHLTHAAAEIEKSYLPKYEEKHQDDDEYEEDDGRYDAWA